jgi:hypothetical protein
LNQRRHPPVIHPTEDLDGNPSAFYNVHHSEMPHFGDPKYVDVWAEDVVTLALQYSTQWDSLAHCGAEFDADGDGVGVEEAVYYDGYRADIDLIGPTDDASGDGAGNGHSLSTWSSSTWRGTACKAAGSSSTPATASGTTGSPSACRPLQEIMDADGVEIEPGDMLLLHTGDAASFRRGKAGHLPAALRNRQLPRRARQPLLEWIAESQISALLADNFAVEGLLGKDETAERHSFLPIHLLCLFRLGVPLGELWYLTDLAAWLRANGRSRFLLTARPLRLPGIVGSPLTPIATV